MSDKNKGETTRDDKSEDKGKKSDGFLERGKKGHDSNNMGNDISGDVKIANSNGELEGGDDKTWHLNEGK